MRMNFEWMKHYLTLYEVSSNIFIEITIIIIVEALERCLLFVKLTS